MLLRILFITSATHKKYMINLNHFQRVYFLSRKVALTIIAKKNSNFSISATKETEIINSPLNGKLGIIIFFLFWLFYTGRKKNFNILKFLRLFR